MKLSYLMWNLSLLKNLLTIELCFINTNYLGSLRFEHLFIF